jgi:hypothetical protein
VSRVLASASSIPAFADARPGVSARDIGRELAATAAEDELRALAAAYIALVIERVRRERAREAECRASYAVYAEGTAGRRALDAAQAERDFEALLADPSSYLPRREQRTAFRKWAGERFDGWHERGHAAAAAEGDDALVLFESDWHPGGPAAYRRERQKRHLWELVDRESEYVRLKTTRELRAAVFALGDGTRTTWGAATVGQHRQRIEALTANAAGIVETATRHRAAIRMIENGGVKCLAELAEAAAAPVGA